MRYFIALRRRWPYWNWVIWEQPEGCGPEILTEGLTLRRKTAARTAQYLIDRLRRMDAALTANLDETRPPWMS